MKFKLPHKQLITLLSIGIFVLAIPISVHQLNTGESLEDRTKAYNAKEIEIDAEKIAQSAKIVGSIATKPTNTSSTTSKLDPNINASPSSNPAILTNKIPPAYLDKPYKANISVKDNPELDLFMQVSLLPEGFSFSEKCTKSKFFEFIIRSKCLLFGDPVTIGPQNILVTITNSQGQTTQQNFTLEVKPSKTSWLKTFLKRY